MRKKMSRLVWALLILAGALTGTLTAKNVDALTCRQLLDQCSAGCNPQDQYCYQDCQCQFLNCKGLQCN
jgi:hypothetical protein